MSKLEKLKDSFRICSGEFPYKDFVALMSALGYREHTGGKTSGSAMKFVAKDLENASAPLVVVPVHKPHGKAFHAGAVRQIRKALMEAGLI